MMVMTASASSRAEAEPTSVPGMRERVGAGMRNKIIPRKLTIH
jgi:hypothetical protein